MSASRSFAFVSIARVMFIPRSTHSHVKLSSLVARLYLEDVEGAGVARGGLHLEDVCRHTAPRRQVHVSVQNSEGFVPAGRVLG